MYIKRCPFYNKNTLETIEHILIECFRWNSIRHKTTIFNIPRLYRTVTIDQSTNNQALNQGRNIMVGKLFGGESKETKSLLTQSRDRYLPYMKELETGRFMNGIGFQNSKMAYFTCFSLVAQQNSGSFSDYFQQQREKVHFF
ncbi:hypothetical protein BB560_007261 [Smittium megazygosporum]|uniref:Uncharacterized protein n=1 Tax=Smittium megazygosporum TaxID=133381 RepID=A0A2T9XXI6_9FUNG|nr:hypothetical protein BB560_007261 [Smittium megazygosporum]